MVAVRDTDCEGGSDCKSWSICGKEDGEGPGELEDECLII